MQRGKLVEMVVERVKEQLHQVDLDETSTPAPVNVDENTVLYGANGVVDSLGLVSVVLDIEQAVNDELGTDLVLADERAVSQKSSPFRTAGTLADYIMVLISGAGSTDLISGVGGADGTDLK